MVREIDSSKLLDGSFNNYFHDAARIYQANINDVTGLSFPSNEQKLSLVLSENYNKPVTIIGGRTGLAGGSVAKNGGHLISMEDLLNVDIHGRKGYTKYSTQTVSSKMVEYALNKDTNQALFPAGIILSDLNSILESHGYMFLPNPTETSAQLGGSVSTNGSGSRSFAFGSVRDSINGLRIILPNGDPVHLERGINFSKGRFASIESVTGKNYKLNLPTYLMPNIKKNAAGLYVKDDMDLIDLFIGSEGSLGTFSEIEISYVKRRNIETGILFLPSEDIFFNFLSSARNYKFSFEQNSGFISLEGYGENALKLMGKDVPKGSQTAIQYEFFSGDDEMFKVLEQLIEEFSVIDGWHTPELISMRHKVPRSVNRIIRTSKTSKISTDLSVPELEYRKMHEITTNAANTFSDLVVCMGGNKTDINFARWGHSGDYHDHWNLISRNLAEYRVALEIKMSLAKQAVALGGSLSGEHGLGKLLFYSDGGELVPAFELMVGKKGMQEILELKQIFDPENVFNKGNIIL